MINESPLTSYGPENTWLNETQAAEITGMSEPWYRKERQKGGGIPYTKIGKSVRYRLADVIAYMREREVHSTSEYKKALPGTTSGGQS